MFYKEKGFYISLLCGIVALVAFGAICVNLMGSENDGEGDTPIVAEETPQPTMTPEPKTEETSSKEVKSEVKKEKKTGYINHKELIL